VIEKRFFGMEEATIEDLAFGVSSDQWVKKPFEGKQSLMG